MDTIGATYEELGKVLAEHAARVVAATREAGHLAAGDPHDQAVAYTRSLEALMVLLIQENNRRLREDLVAAGVLAVPEHLGASQGQLQHVLAERSAAVLAATKQRLHPHEHDAHDAALVYTRALETLMVLLIVENNQQLTRDLGQAGLWPSGSKRSATEFKQ
jgi:hypothetical protein